MNNFPRRSPRFQQQQHQQQAQNTQSTTNSIPIFGSSFSSASSASSTSHPSPTGDSIGVPGQLQQYQLQLQSQYLTPANTFAAPLPSPSANEIDPFGQAQHQFGFYNMGGQAQNQKATGSYQSSNNQSQAYNPQQAQSQSQSQQQQHHHNSFSQAQRTNYPPTSVNGVPPGLPPDFLAEAAKRAQMACLMRDLGDVSL